MVGRIVSAMGGGGKLALALAGLVLCLAASVSTASFYRVQSYTATGENSEQVPVLSTDDYWLRASASSGSPNNYVLADYHDTMGHRWGQVSANGGQASCQKIHIDYFTNREYIFYSRAIIYSGSGEACASSPDSPVLCTCDNPKPNGPGQE